LRGELANALRAVSKNCIAGEIENQRASNRIGARRTRRGTPAAVSVGLIEVKLPCYAVAQAKISIHVDGNGNWTQIGGVSQSFQINAWYHAKLDVIANTVYGKAWLFGAPEPAWQVSGTQSTISTPGVGGLRCGAADVYFQHFSETPITQISGTVTNATTGSGLAGVTVNLSNGTSVVTDSSGKYVFAGLAAGSYTLSAAQNGFNPGTANASVSIGQSAINVTLALTPIAPSPTPGATPTASPSPHG